MFCLTHFVIDPIGNEVCEGAFLDFGVSYIYLYVLYIPDLLNKKTNTPLSDDNY